MTDDGATIDNVPSSTTLLERIGETASIATSPTIPESPHTVAAAARIASANAAMSLSSL
jgi:hypothetical protein